MARQARNYLRGAVSGTALIGVAVVAFVLLVSLQTLRDWPLAGLAEGDDDPAGKAGVGVGRPAAAGAGSSDGLARRSARGASAGAANSSGGGAASAVAAGATSPGIPVVGAPVTGAPGSEPASPTGGGHSGSAPSGSSAGAPSSGSGPGGGSAGGATQPSSDSDGEGGGGDSGPTTSETVTGTVNEAVSGVDQATGDALSGTGVTQVTEETVNGVAGPESTVGKTVDQGVEKVKETVGGILGGGK